MLLEGVAWLIRLQRLTSSPGQLVITSGRASLGGIASATASAEAASTLGRRITLAGLIAV